MYKAKGAKMGENDFIQISGGPKIQRVKLYIPLFL